MAIFGGGKDEKGAAPEVRSAKAAAPGGLSVIGQGMTVRGNIESNGIVKIEGEVVGEVNAASQVLISRGGRVNGDIITREAIIGGAVHGAIAASDRVEIQQGAAVEGDITTRRILVSEGGQIDGNIRMGSNAPAAEAAQPGEGQGSSAEAPVASQSQQVQQPITPGFERQSVARVAVPPRPQTNA